MRPTLSQVAARAGVSRTTASFVLSGRTGTRIADATAERVRRAAADLRYRPNLVAAGLRTHRSHTIGFVSDLVASEPFAGRAIRGAMAAAQQARHLLLVGETGGDAGVEAAVIDDMLDRGVTRFLYVTMYTREVVVPPALRGHPLVLLNCVDVERSLPAVLPDEESAGRAAVRELMAGGVADGAVLVGETPAHVMAAVHRRAGIEAELAAGGLALGGHVQTRWWPADARAATAAHLREHPLPRALVCLNDRVAMGVYQALAERGAAVPDDVAVVSFDDSELATWLSPQLTSVALPYAELGARAVQRLLGDPEEPGGARVELVDMPVRRRGSTPAGPAPRR